MISYSNNIRISSGDVSDPFIRFVFIGSRDQSVLNFKIRLSPLIDFELHFDGTKFFFDLNQTYLFI